MIKKTCSAFLVLLFVFGSVLSSFAASDKLDNEFIYSNDTKTTKQFLVTVTRPDGNESTFKKAYVLCGVSEDEKIEDIEIKLLIYDEETESYISYQNTDGDSSWGLGKYGLYIKEILLPNEGKNKIRIVAYKKSQVDKLVLGENLQINNFTITVLNEDFKEKIKNGISKISELLKGIFSIK